MMWSRINSRVCLLLALATLAGPASAQQSAPQETVPAAPQPRAPMTAGELTHEVTEAVRTQPACAPSIAPCALTPRQKFQIFERRSYSPFTFASAAFDTAYSHVLDPKYGPGVEGFAKRYGATLADGEFRSFFQTFVFSSAFHQDPRFHRLGEGRALSRMAYAASRVFVGRTDSGRSAFNSPELLGALTTSAFSNLYLPARDRGLPETFGCAAGALGSDAATMLLREFWPDIKGWFTRHEPESVKRMEERVDRRMTPRVPARRPQD